MRKIEKIIIHCSATPEGREVTVADIDRWHRQRGFNCIGYHFVVYLDGSVHEGRPVATVGAHCKGQNAKSIGVCYIGGLTADSTAAADTRTPAQKASLRKLVEELKAKFGNLSVHGHSEFAAKACPCFDVAKEFGNG